MKVVTSEQMRSLDKLTIDSACVESKELMRRAGVGFAREVISYVNSYYKEYFKRFVILSGKGNNAGDAYVAANYLYENSTHDVIIYAVCSIEDMSGDAKHYAQAINSSVRVEVKRNLSTSDFVEGDVIIDGLLGTGFTSELKEPYLTWINMINKLDKPVIAIDVPSGLNATSGVGSGVESDLTVTIALPKRGFFIKNGVRSTGKIRVVDIGIPKEFVDKTDSDLNFYSKEKAVNFLRRVPCDIHKKSNGSVLIIGGSKYYTGAPFLSGLSALRSGAGLVTVAVPKTVAISCNFNSLIIRRIEDGGKGIFCGSSLEEIIRLMEDHTAIVVGPGMTSEAEEVLKVVIESDRRVVFDADALNIIASNAAMHKKSDKFVFTPHHGEALRLAKTFGVGMGEDRISFGKELSESLAGTLVYKGNKTLIYSPGKSSYVNSSGSAALATAGSGDVLSGMIGALIANCQTPVFDAAAFAVYLHGCAGELAEIDYGIRGTTADDIVSYIPKAMKSISPFA